jgi:hypothetical protein
MIATEGILRAALPAPTAQNDLLPGSRVVNKDERSSILVNRNWIETLPGFFFQLLGIGVFTNTLAGENHFF